MTTSAASNQKLVDKVRTSALFTTYATAFEKLTGLALGLQAAHSQDPTTYANCCAQNRFCQLINGSSACQACQHAHVHILRAARDHVATSQCFAGLSETAVPVKLGKETVAYLRTGQSLTEPPNEAELDALTERLVEQGIPQKKLNDFRKAYQSSTVIPPESYQQIEKLLAIFSLQLSTLFNQLMLEKDRDEPEVVTKAKAYIREHLMDSLSLSTVADAVGVSSFYFCKIFKQATQMTFTEYVNRKRIECAKQALLQPYARITEVAFEVGYQSLSQFNRSFLKYTGESPSAYRKRMASPSKKRDDVLQMAG